MDRTPLMSISKTLIFLTLVFSTFLHPSLSELCDPKDKEVLLQIKKEFNDPYSLIQWDQNTDCCVDWYGVQCDEKTHRVSTISINDGDLSGKISPQFGNLPYLDELILRKNPNLIGPIPYSISNLKRLKVLIINRSNISGSIPDFFNKLTKLEFLDFSHNKLTGEIPSSIGKLRKLGGLRLDSNKLTGQIPDSFGYFKGNDFYLYLGKNQLSGKIPASLGKKNFSYIDLSRNKLEGDASVLFGSDKPTWLIYISRNLLEFDFSNVKFPKNLVHLDISHNKISGSLPKGLTKLSLQLFDVSYNRLCGKIPQGGRLQTFDPSAYIGNKCLYGPPLTSFDLVTAIKKLSMNAWKI